MGDCEGDQPMAKKTAKYHELSTVSQMCCNSNRSYSGNVCKYGKSITCVLSREVVLTSDFDLSIFGFLWK